ncbi:MAG: hypothetical protein ABL974_11250 [Prosthecobacter sp.]
MTEIITILLRVLVGIGDFVMDMLSLLHWGQEKISESSRVGESPMDRESRERYERLHSLWLWLSLAFILIASLIGGGLSLFR